MSSIGGKQWTQNLIIGYSNEEDEEEAGYNSDFFSGAWRHSALFEMLDLKMLSGNIGQIHD
jgi:hypothetical protein